MSLSTDTSGESELISTLLPLEPARGQILCDGFSRPCDTIPALIVISVINIGSQTMYAKVTAAKLQRQRT